MAQRIDVWQSQFVSQFVFDHGQQVHLAGRGAARRRLQTVGAGRREVRVGRVGVPAPAVRGGIQRDLVADWSRRPDCRPACRSAPAPTPTAPRWRRRLPRRRSPAATPAPAALRSAAPRRRGLGRWPRTAPAVSPPAGAAASSPSGRRRTGRCPGRTGTPDRRRRTGGRRWCPARTTPCPARTGVAHGTVEPSR